jgi:hypothetical protein
MPIQSFRSEVEAEEQQLDQMYMARGSGERDDSGEQGREEEEEDAADTKIEVQSIDLLMESSMADLQSKNMIAMKGAKPVASLSY